MYGQPLRNSKRLAKGRQSLTSLCKVGQFPEVDEAHVQLYFALSSALKKSLDDRTSCLSLEVG